MGPPVASVRARSWRSGLAPEGEDGGGELVGALRWQKVSAAFADRAVPAAALPLSLLTIDGAKAQAVDLLKIFVPAAPGVRIPTQT